MPFNDGYMEPAAIMPTGLEQGPDALERNNIYASVTAPAEIPDYPDVPSTWPDLEPMQNAPIDYEQRWKDASVNWPAPQVYQSQFPDTLQPSQGNMSPEFSDSPAALTFSEEPSAAPFISGVKLDPADIEDRRYGQNEPNILEKTRSWAVQKVRDWNPRLPWDH